MKKMMVLVMLALMLISPIRSFADAAPGDMIVTLGQDLTEQQKNMLLAEMNAPQNVQIVTVTNQEEHQYLGKYVSSSLIGTKAISSAAVTIAEPGSGISVKTNNITWVTKEMYVNALITAGVKDANIYITAPIPVSGTAALTGIIKAYEISAGTTIPESVKQAANQEMVQTATLGNSIGDKNAADLVAKIKDDIAKNKPANDQELRSIIENDAKQLGITLSESQIQSLMDLFNKMKDLNINWNQVSDQLHKAKDQVTNFLESPRGQSFLDKLKQFFISLIDAIKSIFSK